MPFLGVYKVPHPLQEGKGKNFIRENMPFLGGKKSRGVQRAATPPGGEGGKTLLVNVGQEGKYPFYGEKKNTGVKIVPYPLQDGKGKNFTWGCGIGENKGKIYLSAESNMKL